jgi:predicted DNA-binding protein YlxM (UPF0122 family)
VLLDSLPPDPGGPHAPRLDAGGASAAVDRRRRTAQLLDHYGGLLTQHQRETLRLHLEEDWSYAEIATAQGVSRTAVYDLVHRAQALLAEYEAKLGLVAAAERRQEEGERLAARLDSLESELRELRQAVKEIA